MPTYVCTYIAANNLDCDTTVMFYLHIEVGRPNVAASCLCSSAPFFLWAVFCCREVIDTFFCRSLDCLQPSTSVGSGDGTPPRKNPGPTRVNFEHIGTHSVRWVARFFLAITYQNGENTYDLKIHTYMYQSLCMPNGRKIFQMVLKYTNIYHSKAFQNKTQIEVFGMKINYLAILVEFSS
jgi:hypothetical protein